MISQFNLSRFSPPDLMCVALLLLAQLLRVWLVGEQPCWFEVGYEWVKGQGELFQP